MVAVSKVAGRPHAAESSAGSSSYVRRSQARQSTSAAGDAFAAGLLYGLIHADLQTGLAYGNAMSALKFTVPQNLPLIDRADVEQLLAGRHQHLIR